MTRVAIGVHVHTEPARLQATLESIARNTTHAHEVIVIPDGADFVIDVDARVLTDDGPRGGAACLNKLAGSTNADVLVLIESGIVVAPGWLDHLLGALEQLRSRPARDRFRHPRARAHR